MIFSCCSIVSTADKLWHDRRQHSWHVPPSHGITIEPTNKAFLCGSHECMGARDVCIHRTAWRRYHLWHKRDRIHIRPLYRAIQWFVLTVEDYQSPALRDITFFYEAAKAWQRKWRDASLFQPSNEAFCGNIIYQLAQLAPDKQKCALILLPFSRNKKSQRHVIYSVILTDGLTNGDRWTNRKIFNNWRAEKLELIDGISNQLCPNVWSKHRDLLKKKKILRKQKPNLLK